ncbi:YdiU family protein [Arcobacter sp. LA11]|uniref:protein adenylyltransferase SelO n=1 Tax=Arcobacter sp. LA11 TaxID=1898176 RepID=UPI00093226F6|nr:protein adenylyltransferase SelO family protein [Arcobacter sp. LA11]
MNELKQNQPTIKTLSDIAKFSDYSLINTLNSDPDATTDGVDYFPRQVFSGHFVPVKPTPIANPEYIAHSKEFFRELGFDDSLALSPDFISMFSGDISNVPEPMSKLGWACGYALSIYGTEYIAQCPFQTGNGYGDGRAISVLEVVTGGKRWEMQLKGGGKTPYCRGADGRAVLRSSVREFLAQEHMHSLGIPTSRSLSLYTSKTEKVQRSWYRDDSRSWDADIMVSESVAISTRVAPSFIRVGQLELFARRTRKNEHLEAREELEKLVLHLIEREYSEVIDSSLSLEEKVIVLAKEFRRRLTSLVANWVRVGFCQGNFNSDNTAVGGFTLDYGPFGFIDLFDPSYQSWTGGGQHFSFLNQPAAAEKNFHMFYTALQQLLIGQEEYLVELNKIRRDFLYVMQEEMEKMWAKKLGLKAFDQELFSELKTLMIQTNIDYTIFFRELSEVPEDIEPIKKSFYNENLDEVIINRWSQWFEKWKLQINSIDSHELSSEMKLVNPKYILREWILVPAYKKAKEGDYSLVRELQEIMTQPYSEQSKEIEEKYYRLKPSEFFEVGGISHVSCSS